MLDLKVPHLSWEKKKGIRKCDHVAAVQQWVRNVKKLDAHAKLLFCLYKLITFLLFLLPLLSLLLIMSFPLMWFRNFATMTTYVTLLFSVRTVLELLWSTICIKRACACCVHWSPPLFCEPHYFFSTIFVIMMVKVL